ncbi:transposable element Tcb2 transposase [Trichonephila clavipes]|nr:transposable element Tcb2 transposase [Trichonephila clavipes]
MVWGVFRVTVKDHFALVPTSLICNYVRKIFTGDHLHPYVLFCYFHGTGVFLARQLYYRKTRLATGWLVKHSSDVYVINISPRNPDINPMEHLRMFLEHGGIGHHTAPMNFTELWTALANLASYSRRTFPQKLFEFMSLRVAAVIKFRAGPNSVTR